MRVVVGGGGSAGTEEGPGAGALLGGSGNLCAQLGGETSAGSCRSWCGSAPDTVEDVFARRGEGSHEPVPVLVPVREPVPEPERDEAMRVEYADGGYERQRREEEGVSAVCCGRRGGE